MMAGAVHGAGGGGLATHNSKPQEKDDARSGSSRGLMSEGILEQIRELSEEARLSGHKAPLRHAWASPPPGAAWGEAEWDKYWDLYERSMGLEGCAYSEAIHDKPGIDGRPPHRHRVYLALTERGTLVRTGWDYARQEAVCRIMEVDTGQALTRGKHNIRAVKTLRELGREDVVDAISGAGLLDGSRAVAALTPQERAQQERTGISKADVARMVAAAWQASDGPHAFAAALRQQDLALAVGEKKNVPVIVDSSGSVHGLRQMLGMAARADGCLAPKATDIQNRLDGLDLPTVEQARQESKKDIVVSVPSAPAPAPEPPPEAQIPAPVATPPDGATSQAAPKSTEPSLFSVAEGGNTAIEGLESGGPFASLADLGDGPGEPPGPGASPDELARYRAELTAYEERKASAWAAWVHTQSNQKSTGGSNGNVQDEADCGTVIIGGITVGIDPSTDSSGAGESWHDSGTGGFRSADSGGDEGGALYGADGREPAGGDDATDGCGERAVAGVEGATGSDMHEAGGDGRQACRHRIALARATRAIGTLNVSELLDRLDPSRIVLRVIQQEQARIDRRRAEAPFPDKSDRDADGAARMAKSAVFAPMHKAQEALKLALARQEAVSPVPWKARFIPWETPREREQRQAREAVAMAHAAVTAATPSRDRVDDAEFIARARTDNAACAYREWDLEKGQALDREEHLLIGISVAVDDGDRMMRRVILNGGISAGMRLQGRQETNTEIESPRTGREQSNVVGFRPR